MKGRRNGTSSRWTPAGVLGSERRAHHAGMQRVGGDGAGRQPPGQLVGEQDVGELGLVVGPCAGVGPFALEVVEVDPPHGLRVGGDRDHAGRCALLQPVEQQVGEQERREVVEGEGVLEPVGRDVPGVPVAADVVDQHVDPGQALRAPRRPAAAPPPGTTGPRRTRPPARRRPRGSRGRGLGALAVPAGDRDVRAHRGQAQGGRPADAAGGAGDQHGPAGHRSGCGLFHRWTPSAAGYRTKYEQRYRPGARCRSGSTRVARAGTTEPGAGAAGRRRARRRRGDRSR